MSKEQKDELREWRLKTSQGKEKKDTKRNTVKFKSGTEKAIASAVTKQVAEKMKDIDKEKNNEDEVESYIMSVIKKCSGKATVSDASAGTSVPPSLKGIIKRAKNASSDKP